VSCQETQDLLHGYLDGELDLVRTLEIERHLQGCASCALVYTQQRDLRSVIRSSALHYPPPAHLERHVRAAIRHAHAAETGSRTWSWGWLGLGGALAAAAIMLWIAMPGLNGLTPTDQLVQELIAGHVRSLMADHLTDVRSSDTHTVKPWFEGKLDFSPPVIDVTDQGFALLGGRLDYLVNRPVAVLIYRRRQHVINLFIWPAEIPVSIEKRALGRQGYQLVPWHTSEMTYWAVSNLNLRELQEFAQAMQCRVTPAVTP
jgi:anti-sigma factor RsiW